MGKTKKLGRTARFKAKYGKKIKDMVRDIEEKQFAKHECPLCRFNKVRRKASGIFECRKCGAEFAGGAYTPETMIGRTVKKIVSQKTFAEGLKVIEDLKEKKASSEKGVLEEMKEHLEKVRTEESKEQKAKEEE